MIFRFTLKEIESLIANISGVEDISTALSQEDSLQNDYDKLRLQAKIGYILNGYINIEGLESIDIFLTMGIVTMSESHWSQIIKTTNPF